MKELLLINLLVGTVLGNTVTLLLDDSHPCIAENLLQTHRYICDSDANVICLNGWSEPEDLSLRSLLTPCPIPICDFNNRTCAHGECIRPDVCACEVGWQGHLCDNCVKLPGCQYGTCDYAFECNCITDDAGVAQYMGAMCDTPMCPDCDPINGRCLEPFLCTCIDGWRGENCDICIPLAGCVNGDCNNNKAGTCLCREGWTGHLCDEPICSDGCDVDNGFCNKPDECICKTGWENENCTQCIVYWECPTGGTCNEPNQCICDAATVANDVGGFCNRIDINGPVYGPWSACSNPCQEIYFSNTPGTRTRQVRWCPLEGCSDTVESCFGTTSWVISNSGGSDLDRCIYDVSIAPTTLVGFFIY